MVSIGYEEKGVWVHDCTGSILTKKTILTSAKCVQNKSNKKLRTGDEDLSKTDDDQYAQTYDFSVVQALVHPDWKQGENDFDHDLALLKLDTEIEFNENTHAICLPDKSDLDDDARNGHYSIAAGWGQQGGQDQAKLDEAAVTIFAKPYCKNIYSELTWTSSIMCAGHDVSLAIDIGISLLNSNVLQREIDFTCPGDSGAPLFNRHYYGDGVEYFSILGVHAAPEIYEQKKCLRKPALFARLDDPENLDWIEENLV